MNFSSDNAGPVHPRVMQAILKANEGHALAYGADPWTEAAVARVREVLEAPEAAVVLVPTGTAANALSLAAMARPWDGIVCADVAHVQEDECNAPEAFTGGAKLVLVPTRDAKVAPEALERTLAALGRDVHGAQRGPVTITQATERGTVYTVAEVAALAEVAHGLGSRVHMDGARFANAVAGLGCSPADLTWRAGVDVLSLGGTKNGLMAVEAVVAFDPALGRELELRRKRAAHLFSKHRFLGAQVAAALEDGLWLDMARDANAAMARLAAGLRRLGREPEFPVEANLAFVRLPRAMHRRLRDAGAAYQLWEGPLESGDPGEGLLCRLVCDWSTGADTVDRFLAAAAEESVPRPAAAC